MEVNTLAVSAYKDSSNSCTLIPSPKKTGSGKDKCERAAGWTELAV
jgi:hypothetical protein